MTDQVRVAVLGCNRLLRESITRIITKKMGFDVVSSQALQALCADEIVESAADVLVCDSLLFYLEEFSSLTSQRPKWGIKSLLVAMDDKPEDFLAAVRHGVLGYVLQEASAAEVVSAIRAVAIGEAVCPSKFLKLLFDAVAAQPARPDWVANQEHAQLTRREQQLIPLIGRGLTNKEIAGHLNISEQTVKSHVHRILRKVGAEGRQGLSQLRYNELSSFPQP